MFDRSQEMEVRPSPTAKLPIPDGLVTRGEMGGRIRLFDWTVTPLGPIRKWPQSLKTAVNILLNSRYPMFIWWGPELTNVYNDAYIPVLGRRHPAALGMPAREVWKEIWPVVGAEAQLVLREGRATWNDEVLLVMERNNFIEETYFTWSYSPIVNEQGQVNGVFCACTEETARVIGQRRLKSLRDLGSRALEQSRSVGQACSAAAETLAENPGDLPFALVYLLAEDGKSARLCGAAGLKAGTAPTPERVTFQTDTDVWNLGSVLANRTPAVIDTLERDFGRLSAGIWADDYVRQAVVAPLLKPGMQDSVMGFLVAGVSPRLKLDEEYRGFLELTVGHIAAAIANARAYDQERKRAEALAELDRAKTAFFTNVSHEFRTPLTLMLAPLEDLKARFGETSSLLTTPEYQQVALVHRNGLRLLKLVNTLLDFSRLEAGRAEAIFEATDLAASTVELVSVFRSAIEKAGMRLMVDCPPLPEPVYVDREMWEKIVLNLVSNAFKFTFAGEIAVKLRLRGGQAELSVEDTGIGIPKDEVGRVFDRFHRVPGAQGRTHEGTGIGLALVQELARQHGGSVSVESDYGKGSRFRVLVPLGKAHLPHSQIGGRRTRISTAVGVAPFVEEALLWAPGVSPAIEPEGTRGARVLVADDNADMRTYVARLLRDQGHEVVTVSDGEAALASARKQKPDLVLSDVMMPRLDGFGLLRALRADPALSGTPLILLSARAGEESRVEGLDRGADDYLTKPFSARELVARVKSHLEMARVREESASRIASLNARLRGGMEELQTLMDVAPVGIFVAHDAACARITMNPAGAAMLRLPPNSNPSKTGPLPEALPFRVSRNGVEVPHEELPMQRAARLAERVAGEELDIVFPDGRITNLYEYALPLFDDAGRVRGALGVFVDLTERKRTEAALRESENRFRNMADHSPMMLWVTDPSGSCTYLNRRWHEFTGQAEDVALTRGWLEAVHPDDRGIVESAFLTANAKRESFRIEYRLRRHDGAYRWAMDAAAPRFANNGEFLGYIGSVIDIQERREAEDAIRHSREQLQLIGDSVPALISYVDTERRYRMCNRAYLVWFGLSPETILGRRMWDVVGKDAWAAIQPHVDTAFAGQTTEFETEVRYQRGGKRWIHAVYTPHRDAQGAVMGIVVMVTDITPRVQAEQQLNEAHLLLADRAMHLETLVSERTAKLQESIGELEAFSYSISHDMRAPLRAMQSFGRILQEECEQNLGEEGRDYLRRIINASERMDRLILDVLTYSRMARDFQLESVDTHKLLSEIIHSYPSFQPPAADLEVVGELPRVMGNIAALTQCFSNLLGNAVKFVAPGITPRIQVGAEDVVGNPALVRLCFRDNGIGISQEHHARIFGMFQKLNTTYEGTGIGLAIVKKAAERMGGTVGLQSQPGQGSTFWLQLARAP